MGSVDTYSKEPHMATTASSSNVPSGGEYEKIEEIPDRREITVDKDILQYIHLFHTDDLHSLVNPREDVFIDDSEFKNGKLYVIGFGKDSTKHIKSIVCKVKCYTDELKDNLAYEAIDISDVKSKEETKRHLIITAGRKSKVWITLIKDGNMLSLVGRKNEVVEVIGQIYDLLSLDRENGMRKRKGLLARLRCTSVDLPKLPSINNFFGKISESLRGKTTDGTKPKVSRSPEVMDDTLEETTCDPFELLVPKKSYSHVVSHIKIHVAVEDITKMQVDAIVNAANENLDHGGGVAEAILKAGGSEIKVESKKYIKANGKLPITETCLTTGGMMPCLKVIHTVGPQWSVHSADECLKQLHQTFSNVLKAAEKENFVSIAIPAISSGIFGMPLTLVADICVASISEYLTQHASTTLKEVHLVNIDSGVTSDLQMEMEKQVRAGVYSDITDSDITDRDLAAEASGGTPDIMVNEISKQEPFIVQNITGTTADGFQQQALSPPQQSEASGGIPDEIPQQELFLAQNMTGTTADGFQHQVLFPPQQSGMPNTEPTGLATNSTETLHSVSNTDVDTLVNHLQIVPGRSSRNHTQGSGEDPKQSLANLATNDSFHGQRSNISQKDPQPKAVQTDKNQNQVEETDDCCICMCPPSNPKTLHKCKHTFCTECIDRGFKIKPACPICGAIYGRITGDQPKNGTMSHRIDRNMRLPGYESCGAIIIDYSFPSGIQSSDMQSPGQPYTGTYRTAYLPDNQEGRKVLELLKQAFDARVTFTVGRSRTTGADNTVTWNDIHHKTSTHGGPSGFGFPDPEYLQRVQEELAAKGIK